MNKRGVCFSHKNPPSSADLQVLAEHGVSWWYNWGSSGLQSSNIDFVPMLHSCSSDIRKVEAYVDANPSTRFLLVLNEPNHLKQANATPHDAAKKWPEWEALADRLGLNLVGPQLTYGKMKGFEQPDIYLDKFIEEYCVLNDGRTPRIDALGYHFYGQHGLRGHLNNLHRFGKPIWLTEFAHFHADTVEEQKAWMTKAVALCEERADVVRYAWFIGRASSEKTFTLLEEDGSLNDLGAHYVGLPHGNSGR
jgi:hypothetical protein